MSMNKTRTKKLDYERELGTQLRMFVHYKIHCCGCSHTFEDIAYKGDLCRHVCGAVGLVERRIGSVDSYYICRNIGFSGAHHKLCHCSEEFYHNENSPGSSDSTESEVKIFYGTPGIKI